MSTFFTTLRIGPCVTNCYIFSAGDTAVVVDPGGEADPVIAKLKTLAPSSQTIQILITHTHSDHFMGADSLLSTFPGSHLYVSVGDEPGLYDPQFNCSGLFKFQLILKNKDAVKTVAEGDVLEFGPYKIKVIETPGHTRGGVSYVLEEEKTVFSGDTLFKGNVGRSDLPGGDGEQLIKSICEKLIVLPDDFQVYPGHGPSTTIKREKQFFE
jgi:glyoxylase-like metal-dependent hydrolase (beta-lactamase superfamily II)